MTTRGWRCVAYDTGLMFERTDDAVFMIYDGRHKLYSLTLRDGPTVRGHWRARWRLAKILAR